MNTLKDTIAKNLNFYRKLNNYTQRELAEKIGVKHNAISSWENGTNSIDIDTLFILCEIFKISINDMYGITTEQDNVASENAKVLSEIYQKSKQLSEEEQLYVLNQIKGLLELQESKHQEQ